MRPLLYRLWAAIVATSLLLGSLAPAEALPLRPIQRGLFKPATPAYIGPVATRSYVPNLRHATVQQVMVRSPHYARDNITSMQIAYANWYVKASAPENGAEIANTGTASIELAVEYPSGTYTRVKYSGLDVGTEPDGGTLLSDPVAVNIPAGAMFWLRPFITYNGTARHVYSSSASQLARGDLGEQFDGGVSGISNRVMGGAIAANNTGIGVYPVLIIGRTSKRSFYLMGDSRMMGTHGGASLFDTGEIATSIGSSHAYINAGTPNSQISWWLASNARQRALAAYCSDILDEFGINDLRAGRTAAQILADKAAARALFPGKRFYLQTIPGQTASNDNWKTLPNQTIFAQESERLPLNAAILAGVSGVTGVVDVAGAVMDTTQPGKWKVNNTTNWQTDDGLHETVGGLSTIVSSNVVRAAVGL